MSRAVRPYRGATAEERQANRRARLLSACLDVVGEVGVLGVTVDAACARAGLTKRYFYETFADRDAALEAVTDDVYGGLHTSIVSALRRAEGDARARAATAVEVFAATLDADPRVARLTRRRPATRGSSRAATPRSSSSPTSCSTTSCGSPRASGRGHARPWSSSWPGRRTS